jgi:hypothetical protein
LLLCSRKDTGKTARMLALKAQQGGEQALFDCSQEEVGGAVCPSRCGGPSRQCVKLLQ